MLVEPPEDAERLALDRAVAKAVRARLAAGARPTPDADAIARRAALYGCGPAEREALMALWGRQDAAGWSKAAAWGTSARLLSADRHGPRAQAVAEPEQALAVAAEGGRALLDVDGGAWWGRLLARPDLRVVGCLPDAASARPRALLVAALPSGPTGDDRTFWVTDAREPDAVIVDRLGALGLAATPLAASGGLKLFVLTGYVQANDGRLDGAPGSLSGVIGAAPVF